MIKLYDRIKELSYVIGTGNITLSGAVRGFSTFSSCYINNDLLFYAVTDGTNYELGSGVYVASSNSIQRFPVRSTNSNNKVSFTEGTKEVYVNYPATNSVFSTSGVGPVPLNSGLAFWSSANSLSYSNKFVVDSGRGRVGINKSSPSYALDLGGISADAIIRSSGLLIGSSGISFPSGNNGTSSYSGGIQLVHFEPNQLGSSLSSILELSGIVNQNILLKKQNAGMVFAGPSNACSPPCDPAYPSFRILTAEDIPDISNLANNINTVSGALNNRIIAISGINGLVYSVSGTLDHRITAVSGVINAASGALNNRITAVSGYLDNRINSITPGGYGGANILINNGRLSTSSTDPIVDGYSDSLYFVPYNGNYLSLYDGSSWQTVSFNSILVKTTSTLFAPGAPVDPAGKVFDIFAYLSGTDIMFDAQVWTNTTTRLVELGIRDGIYVKSTDHTRRYIGSVMPVTYAGIAPAGGNKFHNINNHQYIYNHYNKINKVIRKKANIAWTCNSSTWRHILNVMLGGSGPIVSLNTMNVKILCGIAEDTISVRVSAKFISSLIPNSNYMITVTPAENNSYLEYNIESNNSSTYSIGFASADSNDNITKQIYGSFSHIPPIGIQTYNVAEKVLSGRNTPNLAFDYTNGLTAEWRC